MRYLLATLGSTGDVHPFFALGAALRQAGHQVTLLADARYAAAAQSAQIDFAAVPRQGNGPALDRLVAQMLVTPNRLDQFEVLYGGLAPVFGELLDEVLARLPEHDVLVTSYFFPYLKNAARRAGRKSAVLVFCPNNVPFAESRPEEAPAPPGWLAKFFPVRHNHLMWDTTEKLLDNVVARHAGAALRAHGLDNFHGFLRDPANRALVTVSSALFPPPGPLPENYSYTGFLRWSPPVEGPAIIDLTRVAALERAGVPLPVLTFGSMAPADARENFARLLAAWPQGKPLVVQTGWADWQEDPRRPEVLVIGSVPHDRLFERATIVIHHGGAGTTAAALHAGRPQIIIPHLGDQNYWAQAAEKLGIARVLPRESWPEKLAGAIAVVLRDSGLVHRAVECAAAIRAEDGAAQAVRVLENL